MRPAHALTVLLCTAAAAASPAIASAAPAATPAATGSFATVYSLTNGPCVAIVNTSVYGDAYPGQAAFTVDAQLPGVGTCDLPITLTYRNVDTGDTGSIVADAQGPGYWSRYGYSAIFPLDPGTYTAQITIGAAHFPEPGTVQFTQNGYHGG
ncbi:hypothetical protein D7D52_29770 [Nocardia yunnanensis]|uniref:Uncharacterized protein n=1 Tax=Nocardia yunnanensis TaxID=2382165 RepID=A0A386ZIE4_9NOCA|nr:hypothetical protein [Nocardia yunnanensis]AYF77317.1 hypothetical protein D7D52_29770 [Nocardia yunnanensis]